MFRFFRLLIIVVQSLVIFTSQASFAKTSSQSLILRDEDRLRSVAQNKQWLHLLHYHQVGFTGHGISQADDPDFFLSERGVSDPYAELIENLRQLPNNIDNAQCTFPARTFWLQKQFPEIDFVPSECPDFERWRQEINAENLSLIFPAAYLNSPSSMFGHTLIRIDSATHDNDLLDYTVNYAANADPDDNELVFTYKGLSGGYPGLFSVLPYYEKVKEYSYLEARDVWEYELDITQQELAQFIRHVWELKDIKFDYYFFTENCSYHLLTLLDGASERFDLSARFATNVIPADTVRALNRAGLIKQAKFRPSSRSTMQHMMASMTETQTDSAINLVNTPGLNKKTIQDTINHYSETDQAQVLELAYRFSRYQSLNNDDDGRSMAKTSLNLLSARSKLKQGSLFPEHLTPSVRDDQGHFSHRHQVTWGSDQDTHFADYGLRMSYHDWLDNIDGYLKGAQLQLGEIKFRYQFAESRRKAEDIRVEKIGLIDIASLSGRDDFFKPLSWFVSTGFDRLAPSQKTLAPFLRAGPGLSWQSGAHTLSLLSHTQLQVSSHIDKGHHLSTGPRLAWLSQTSWGSVTIDGYHLTNLSGAEYESRSIKLGASIALSPAWQIRTENEYLEFENETGERFYDLNWSLSLLRYF